MKTTWHFLYLIIITLLFISCDKEIKEETLKTPAPKTILIYMLGDNSLNKFVDQNIKSIKENILQYDINASNLLIYIDKINAAPKLIQLKPENENIKEILIDTYDTQQNSATAETLHAIVEKIHKDFPADSYGLILWSHGSAWLPSNYNKVRSRSFGEDKFGNSIEINDLASALSKFHFDFILFDACYMASTEVVYSLRKNADYIIGSPTEIMGEGFPYRYIMNYMFQKKADVIAIANQFYEYYKNSYGSISVIKTANLDKLALSCQTILQDKTKDDIFTLPVYSMQVLEYLTPSPHALYDFDNYISHLATKEQYGIFHKVLEEAIIYKASTPQAYYALIGSAIEIKKFCGLSTYIPQENLPELNEWYKTLEWYKDIYLNPTSPFAHSMVTTSPRK